YPKQSSGVLSSVVYADGLAIVPIGTQVKPGDNIEVLLFSQFI
ncbi:MAG: molybdopterin molybdenumtransferase MoeA, partial [Pseudomonadota bacterium]